MATPVSFSRRFGRPLLPPALLSAPVEGFPIPLVVRFSIRNHRRLPPQFLLVNPDSVRREPRLVAQRPRNRRLKRLRGGCRLPLRPQEVLAWGRRDGQIRYVRERHPVHVVPWDRRG